MKEYIERTKLIERIEEELSLCEGQDPEKRPIVYGCELGLRGALSYARTLPAGDVVEVKRGRWIEVEWRFGDVYYDCSVCGESFCLIDGTPTDNLYNFCPNCGADMREVDHE